MELKTKNFIQSNPHPKGKRVGDCVVRAIVHAFDKDYMETRRELNQFKREYGHQSYKDHDFISDYLKDYEQIKFKAVTGQPRDKVHDFMKKYPTGTYILKVRHHVTVVIDGFLKDSWDCGYLTVYKAWKIK